MPHGMAVTRRRHAVRRGVRLEQGRRLRHRGARGRHVRARRGRPHRRERRRPDRPRARRGARPPLRADPLRQRRVDRRHSRRAAEIAHVADVQPRAAERRRRAGPSSTTRGCTSSNGEAACASCHIFGDFDSLGLGPRQPGRPVVLVNPNPILLDDFFGLSFDGFHPLKGPMTTQSLRGMANHGPMHWRGDRTGGNDAPTTRRAVSTRTSRSRSSTSPSPGCSGASGPAHGRRDAGVHRLHPAGDLSAQPDPQPRQLAHGRPAAGRDLLHRPRPTATSSARARLPSARSGDRASSAATGKPPSKASRSSSRSRTCETCTRRSACSASPVVGVLPGGDNGFKGDQVRGFGFLHDGSVDTVFRFLHEPGVQPGHARLRPNPDGFKPGAAGDLERRQVESFVLAIDSNLAPIVGQQITLTASNGAVVGAAHRPADRARGGGRLRPGGEGPRRMRRWQGWLRAPDGTFGTGLPRRAGISDAALRARRRHDGTGTHLHVRSAGIGIPRRGRSRRRRASRTGPSATRTPIPDDRDSSPAQLGPWVRIPTRTLRLKDASGPPSLNPRGVASPSRRRPTGSTCSTAGSSRRRSFSGGRSAQARARC